MAAKPKIPPLAERKPEYITTPIGTVRFSALEKPDTAFGDERPKWQLVILLTQPEADTLRAKIEVLNEQWLAQVKTENPKKTGLKLRPLSCFREDTDKGGNPTGLVRFSAHTDAFRTSTDPATGETVKTLRPIPLFDKTGAPVTGVRCYSGARVRMTVGLKFSASQNPQFGIGISTFLNAVQIIKASGGSRDAAFHGFSAVEDEESDISTDSTDASESDYEEGQDL